MTLSEAISAIGLVTLVVLLTAGLGSTLVRAWRWWRAGYSLPDLLPRDVLVIGGFALTVVLVVAVTALGLGPVVRDEPLWRLLVVGVPNAAAAVYLWYEVHVVGRRRPPPGPPGG